MSGNETWLSACIVDIVLGYGSNLDSNGSNRGFPNDKRRENPEGHQCKLKLFLVIVKIPLEIMNFDIQHLIVRVRQPKETS